MAAFRQAFDRYTHHEKGTFQIAGAQITEVVILGLLCGAVWLVYVLPASMAHAFTPVELVDCPTCPPMAVLPAQRLQLGSDDGRPEEMPAYQAVLPRPIAMATTETTFTMWAACVAAKACPAVDRDNGWGRGQRPIIRVTWYAAQRYAAWLASRTGKLYRLPTEDEWEIAARAGTLSRYHWGEEMQPGYAHCRHCDRTDLRTLSDKGVHKTVPVATLRPNIYGLYDMVGNVWEWTASCWTERHDLAYETGGACEKRAVRGGSWYFFGAVAGSAARTGMRADQISYDVGVRVVRELTQAEIMALPSGFPVSLSESETPSTNAAQTPDTGRAGEK